MGDRPAGGGTGSARPARLPWPLLRSEFAGTALLVAVGCCAVILDFGKGSFVVHLLSDPALRRAVTRFLFGAIGAIGGGIAVTPVGKVSGALINQEVTLAFWMRKSLPGRVAAGYVVAQLAGAVVGAGALNAWGPMARSVALASTSPGPAGAAVAAQARRGATFALAVGLFTFLGHRAIRRFTPGLFAPLYAFLVWREAPVSGTSTDPARTLGPAVVGHVWAGWPVYWIGPAAGTVLAILLLSGLAPPTPWEVEVAKMYHSHHDPHGVLRARGAGPPR